MDKYVNVNIILSKFSKKYMDLKKDLPIRPSEMGLLNIITRREGLYTPIMIAELLEVTKVMVTNHVSALEEKGYITKQYLETDKRSFYVIPTDKAKSLVSETETKLNQKFKKLEAKLGSKKFEELLVILEEARVCLED